MSNLAELVARRAELEEQIASMTRAGREEAIASIHDLMTQYGLTASDLVSDSLRKRPGVPGPRAGGKAAVKFRDDSGNSWSGRGLQPRWLKAAVASGKSVSDFAV